MRTIDEILAEMTAIVDGAHGRDFTDDEVTRFEALEGELDQAQRSQQIRDRHAQYTMVVTPAGVPRQNPGPAETIDDAFRHYLRTGRPNADIEQLRPTNALGTTTGSSGGYLVPEGFLARIVEVVKSYGGVKRNVETITTDTGNPLPFPTLDDTSNEATISAENTPPVSGADLTFGVVELGAYEYTASGPSGEPVKVPLALVQDSAFDVEALLARKLGERIGRKMARDAVLGTGTGQPQGILTGITGQELAAANVDYEDLLELVMALDEAYWPNAKWYMSRASLGQVMRIRDDDSSLIFRQGVTLTDTSATQVAGAIAVGGILAPVVLDSAIPSVVGADASINWAIFGDVEQGYIWRDVRAVEVLVNPYTSAKSRQIEYLAWARADGRQKNTAAYKVLAGHTP